MSDKTRAEFEYWASDDGENTAAVERSGNGYKLAQIQAYWQAWLAAKKRYESRWIPIETAPNERGERVLILKDLGEGSLPSESVAHRLEGGPEWYFSDASHEAIESYGYRVTHWMPLPPAAQPQVPDSAITVGTRYEYTEIGSAEQKWWGCVLVGFDGGHPLIRTDAGHYHLRPLTEYQFRAISASKEEGE